MSGFWEFMNSELGITIIAGIVLFILGKVFTAKPKWKVYFDKYKPILMRGVKFAEKQIPDDIPNKAKARLDAALKYVIELNGKLAGKNEEALKAAITEAHVEAETGKNL